MDRSYPYSRRLVSRARLRKRMAAVAAAGLAGAAAVFMLAWKPEPIAAAVPAPFMPALALNDVFGTGEAVQRGVRRIYPYSVVPGGVGSHVELKRVIRTDSVVAAHYATFDAGKAHALVVDKPRAVHVSYRKGDKVYWTAHKVMLAPGETLLSDGSNEMRARCANRISDTPQYPVEAHRPTMEELDQPVELAEGERYAFGPDGMPVAMGADGAIGRHTGMRFPTRGGSGSGSTGSGSAGTPAGGTLAGSLSSGSGSMGTVSTMGLSGSSSSLGSRPRPTGRPVSTPASDPAPAAPAAPAPATESDSGSSGSSGSPAPSSGEPGIGAGEPATSPAPGTTTPQPSGGTATPPGGPATEPVPQAPLPAPLPDLDPAPVPAPQQPAAVTAPPAPPPADPPPSQPPPATQPAVPKPTPEPLPPQPIEQPAPAEVPEPASLWLFGVALAAMGVLRRTRRLVVMPKA